MLEYTPALELFDAASKTNKTIISLDSVNLNQSPHTQQNCFITIQNFTPFI